MPYDYNATVPEYDLVPEGEHEFFIDAITEKYSKKDRPMVEIVLKPSDVATQKFGRVWHYIMLDSEFTESNVGRLLAAMGKDPRQPGRINFSDFKGEYLTAEIKHQDDDRYGSKAVVKKFLSNFSENLADDIPTKRKDTPIRTDAPRDHIERNDHSREAPPHMPQDDFAGNDPFGDDIPF